ncbi:unnamed protein product [Hermetia illucens]|uniref:Transmembrane protein 164 n=1 Tax=Hermetia illucens TaxID=343691 RepID=A0A7R8UXV6_HERIL|nr:transmembrane protein 164 [Hermetia illucens]XP_037917538.1 transmembrane protein 164 [Hermetia illucens]XP_037917539.1 transmembrane protein 164 [Hermetia illucens]CAD7089140.1 unnamed protein product [Hermetia illucens]
MDWSWALEGVTEAMPRTTGPECVGFLSTRRKIAEGILMTAVCIITLKWAIQRIQPIANVPNSNYPPHYPRHSSSTLPPSSSLPNSQEVVTGKQLLLVIMTFVLGIEMGFKLSTKTMIFALNPCHITTIIQIYLLAAKPSKTTTALFRIQMNYLNGPLLAFLFPEVDSRQLPFEATIYWIQHGLMFIIPIYLLRLGGAYNMEDILDFKWNIIAYTLLIIYHFTALQILSVISHINLNHMLCSSASDPFEGPNYRLAAFVHQAFLCPFLCKLWCILFTPAKNPNQIQLDVKIITNSSQPLYSDYDGQLINSTTSSSGIDNNSAIGNMGGTGVGVVPARIDDRIMTTKID